MEYKKLLCRSWVANPAKLFLALMGEAMLRASDGYEELPSEYEFEKRYLMPAYYILARRKEMLTDEQIPAFEAALNQQLEQMPQVEVSFMENGLFKLKMPSATYTGEWKISEGLLVGGLMMRNSQHPYQQSLESWELTDNGNYLSLKRPLLNALSLSVPLAVREKLPIYFEAEIAEISQNRLIVNYRSARGLMNLQFAIAHS